MFSLQNLPALSLRKILLLITAVFWGDYPSKSGVFLQPQRLAKGRALARPSERSERFEPVVRLGVVSIAAIESNALDLSQ